MHRQLLNIVAGPLAAREHDQTRANHAAYAERCDAAYRVVHADAPAAFPLAVKWLASKEARRADQTLLLDVDCVVTRDAPDLFAETPIGAYAAVDELRLHGGGCETWQALADTLCVSQSWPRRALPWSLNSGVLMLPRDASAYAPPKWPFPRRWCAEQMFLSLALDNLGADLVRLDPRWNWCFWFEGYQERKQEAFIVHQNDADRDCRWRRLRDLVAEIG